MLAEAGGRWLKLLEELGDEVALSGIGQHVVVDGVVEEGERWRWVALLHPAHAVVYAHVPSVVGRVGGVGCEGCEGDGRRAGGGPLQGCEWGAAPAGTAASSRG